MRKFLLAACATFLFSATANAQFDLQITEIFPGSGTDPDVTADWFEVTNFGDTAFTFGTDGDLFFDDDSQDAGTADQITGISVIAAGESVIFIDDADATEFISVWEDALSNAGFALPQIAFYDGAGLSGGGDGVTLFRTDAGVAPTTDDIIDFEAYGDQETNNPGETFDVVLAGFSGDVAANAIASAPNAAGEPAIGTPGFLAVAVPEPSSIVIAGIAICGLISRRRR